MLPACRPRSNAAVRMICHFREGGQYSGFRSMGGQQTGGTKPSAPCHDAAERHLSRALKSLTLGLFATKLLSKITRLAVRLYRLGSGTFTNELHETVIDLKNECFVLIFHLIPAEPAGAPQSGRVRSCTNLRQSATLLRLLRGRAQGKIGGLLSHARKVPSHPHRLILKRLTGRDRKGLAWESAK